MIAKNKDHQYADYAPSDFDNFDCLKVSKGVYLLLLFVLRGYLVWLISVTNMKDRVSIIQWIYPDPKLFYLSLVSGLVGLYVVLVLSLRRPDAKNWVRISWRNLRIILMTALTFDLVVNLVGASYLNLDASVWLAVELMIVLGFAAFLYTSKRVQLNIAEFPEKIEEDKPLRKGKF